MFNRSVKLTFVKDKKTEDTQTENKTFIDYVDITTEVASKIAYGAVVVLGTWIVLDTIRQTTVKIVESKCS